MGPLWGAAVFDLYGTGAPFLTATVGIGLAFLLAFQLRRPQPDPAAAQPARRS